MRIFYLKIETRKQCTNFKSILTKWKGVCWHQLMFYIKWWVFLIITWKGPGMARSLSAGQWAWSLICYYLLTGRHTPISELFLTTREVARISTKLNRFHLASFIKSPPGLSLTFADMFRASQLNHILPLYFVWNMFSIWKQSLCFWFWLWTFINVNVSSCDLKIFEKN